MERDRTLCRGARALVDWSQVDLAQRSNVHASTVKAFESGEWVHPNHIEAMKRAFLAEGVIFSTDEQGNPSVSRQKSGGALYEMRRLPSEPDP